MQWTEFLSRIRYLSTGDQARVKQAFDLGKKVHEGQKRRSGEPYFNHPIRVAELLAELRADAETIIATLLHDTVEDTPLTLQEIEAEFGSVVSTLIDGVTKLSRAELPAGKINLDEQIETLRKMFRLMQKDIRIMVIKLYDRLHNMQTAEFLPPEKQKNLATETLTSYVKIADRLCMQDLRDDLEGLCLAILEPEIFGKLMHLRTENEHKVKTLIKNMRRIITDGHREALEHTDIQWEPTTWERRRAQLLSDGATVTGQTSLAAAFICDSVDRCYEVLGLLHQRWQREQLSFQDYINAPAINGYQGLHTTIIFSDGTRIRCKIRTTGMHEYARKGVAARCFQSNPPELLTSLPWMQRLTPLTEDTTDKSEPFMESLQSDILGESIVVHGPDDRGILLPKGSTALDGALHLFGDMAMRTREIFMDGRLVPFNEVLTHACTLSVTSGETERVSRSWLDDVRTGFATALIRQALANATREQKVTAGRKILQEHFLRKNRASLTELRDSFLRDRLQEKGYGSLEEVSIQMAEGRLTPEEIDQVLFGPEKPEAKKPSRRHFILRCVVPGANRRLLLEILQYYRVPRVDIQELNGTLSYHIRMILSEEEVRTLEYSLRSMVGIGSWHLSRAHAGQLRSAAIFLMTALWGLDPVMARVLLQEGISPLSLTFLRFMTIFAAGSIAYLFFTIATGQRMKRLAVFQPALILSAGLLFLTALFTYMSLALIEPTQYILFIIGGVMTFGAVRDWRTGSGLRWTVMTLGLILATIGALTVLLDTPVIGLLFGVASGVAFSLYSIVSRRYQETVNVIRVRYPAFIFWVSVFAALLSLTLLPLIDLGALSFAQVAQVMAFSAVFIFIPYILYFECMRRLEPSEVDKTLPVVVVWAMAGNILLTNSWLPLIVAPLLFVLLWPLHKAVVQDTPGAE